MAKEKVFVFLDYANINRAGKQNSSPLDYHHLLRYLSEGRFLVDAHCYVPINPRNEHRLDAVIEDLWRSGYIVTTKLGTIAGGTYKCNFDVEITMDILEVVHQVKPDIIVLASGDSDFVPLIQKVRKSGIRVEVAAFAESVGVDILLKGSGFIDLAVYYEDYLAAQEREQDEEDREDQYQDLIQSQQDEQDVDSLNEDSTVEQEQDMHPSQDSDREKVDAKVPVVQAHDEAHMTPAELIQELEL